MAPELAQGSEAVRPLADVFSFGVMAFEMLSSHSPFAAPPLYDRLAGRELDLPASLRGLCPELDPALCDALQRCLKEDPAARPTMSALRAVLERVTGARAG
jgi:serine/threonine protein kinase